MSWLHQLFEPEETVGKTWARAAEHLAPAPRYPEAAVRLETQRARLAVFFRGLGGDSGVELRALPPERSAHRAGLLRRVARGSERTAAARFDGQILGLPEVADVYPEQSLNADLLLWLAAVTAFSVPPEATSPDPLQADLISLRAVRAAVITTLSQCPGLAAVHARLAKATLAERPAPRLPSVEAQLEEAIRALLLTPTAPTPIEGNPLLSAILGTTDVTALEAPLDYKTWAPVPMWPVLAPAAVAAPRRGERSEEEGGGSSGDSEKRLKAERRAGDQADRRDSLILHRFEHILTWAEFLNVNRHVEDDDEDNARKVADDADRVSVVKNRKKAATRLKFDLDLSPQDVDTERLSGVCLYPEWDWRRGVYHRDHCRVLASPADAAPEGLKLDAAARRRIAAVQRRFEAVRPRRSVEPRQIDGEDLDLDAVVRSAVELKAVGEASDRIWRRRRDNERELAVSVLVDTSRSTESACGARTVIDIAREALVALTEGIAACGDQVCVHAFASLRRDRVFVRTVKSFDEAIGPEVRARIAGLKPGFYTRIGPAVRHATNGLVKRAARKRLLIVLTDGKPNDLDHYEGRYGIEDTRRAVLEARRQGLAVFGVTVDAKARSYFPYIFGANGYAIVSRPEKLITALPGLWQHLVDA